MITFFSTESGNEFLFLNKTSSSTDGNAKQEKKKKNSNPIFLGMDKVELYFQNVYVAQWT